ncbi:hypothetical protein TWF506_002614 [Arthrobotrys conoides]|uniref:Uncharacterized protein n=1 Tax=Arthrobotrys conoides TaxID=74498 RepID=A0AAN8RM97_9PEZI
MHFSTLLTTATVALFGLTEVASGHMVVFDAWGSNRPKIHGYGLGFSQKNNRKKVFGRILDVAVFDRTVLHDKNNATYLNNGCGFSGNSVGYYYKTKKPAVWSSQKRKKFFFERKSDPEGRIVVPRHVEALSVQERQGKSRKRYGPKDQHKVKTGIPKVAAGRTLVVLTRALRQGPRMITARIDYKGNAQTWTKQLKLLGCAPPGKVITPGCSPAKFGKFYTKFKFQLPPNMDCRGAFGVNKGIKNICMVRVQDALSHKGPFGACIPIQQKKPPATRKVVRKTTVAGRATTVTEIVTAATPVPQPVTTSTTTIVETITQPPRPTVTVRVVKVPSLPYTYVIYVNGKAVPTKATKVNQVITETVTVFGKPVVETATIIQKDEFEDETGGDEGGDDNETDPDLKDEAEDEDDTPPDDGDDESSGDENGDDEEDIELDDDDDMNYARKLRFLRD